jgi:hypothetical protein
LFSASLAKSSHADVQRVLFCGFTVPSLVSLFVCLCIFSFSFCCCGGASLVVSFLERRKCQKKDLKPRICHGLDCVVASFLLHLLFHQY